MNVLVINCGSSSVKFALFASNGDLLAKGKRERLSSSGESPERSHTEATASIFKSVKEHQIHAVGHRVVHGGSEGTEAMLITDSVLDSIGKNIPSAPMHNPFALNAIKAAQAEFPSVPHVAVFDTAFHSRMPRRATTYAIDVDVASQHGIRRFGFHGISHEYAAGIAAEFLERPLHELRLVTLHLGNGASACAVEFGRSAETSMGNTPLEGLVMGTRSGDVDAGVILSLLRSGYDVDGIDALLNKQSGLAGLSGLGNDLREIERAAAEGDDRARLAITVFAHRARKYVGAYAAAMGGLDAIVFTGGIGENSASMRARILQRLEFLGVVLDEDLNRDASVIEEGRFERITTARSRVEAIVVKTNEELMIARETTRVVNTSKPVGKSPTIPIAVSARHCHLTEATFKRLFGDNAQLTPYKELSQPGQFAAEQRINLVGPRDRIDGVRILGPLRKLDQIEISRTDEYRLGVDAPVRDSGNVVGSAPITLEGPNAAVTLSEGLICARRHIHMHPEDAAAFGVSDKDEVSVAVVGGVRDLVFGDVLIRVKESYKLEMHIDTDEANAAELEKGASGDLRATDIDDGDVYHNIVDVSAMLKR